MCRWTCQGTQGWKKSFGAPERVRKAGMICQDLGHKYGKRPRRGASTAKPLHRKAFELFFGATELGVGNRKVTLVDVGSTRSRRRASVPQKTGTERCPLVTRHPSPMGYAATPDKRSACAIFNIIGSHDDVEISSIPGFVSFPHSCARSSHGA